MSASQGGYLRRKRPRCFNGPFERGCVANEGFRQTAWWRQQLASFVLCIPLVDTVLTGLPAAPAKLSCITPTHNLHTPESRLAPVVPSWATASRSSFLVPSLQQARIRRATSPFPLYSLSLDTRTAPQIQGLIKRHPILVCQPLPETHPTLRELPHAQGPLA